MDVKTLITGGSGRLGKELAKRFPEALHPDHSSLDFTSDIDVDDFIKTNKPDLIIHTAALTNVRECENNHSKAWANNVVATENLVKACQTHVNDVYFVAMSTACVFRGDIGGYVETDIPYPDNFYSLTKLVSEFVAERLVNHLVIRANFVPRERWRYERAFVDRFGTYLFADDLAGAIESVVKQKLKGIIHVCGSEKLSMFELAKITTPDIMPMTMKDVDIPVPRDMSLRSIRIPPFEITR